LGVALGTWAKLDPVYGKTCMIIGAGSIGLCCLAVAKAMGMRKIVVVATSSKRLKAARELGAYATVATREEDLFEAMKKYHPEGTDYIIEATGIEECIQNSLKLCKKGGYVALAGYGRGKTMSIRIDDIHVNNLHVVGAGNNWNQHKKAIQMMADGVVDMTPFISETLDLSEFQKGLDDARNRPEGFIKAIFTFDNE
jgi:L-iditol 2-dehydrogenase